MKNFYRIVSKPGFHLLFLCLLAGTGRAQVSPSSQTVLQGGTATFTCTASATFYWWSFQGDNIGSSATLTLHNVTTNQSGWYQVATFTPSGLTNGTGDTYYAQLTVLPTNNATYVTASAPLHWSGTINSATPVYVQTGGVLTLDADTTLSGAGGLTLLGGSLAGATGVTLTINSVLAAYGGNLGVNCINNGTLTIGANTTGNACESLIQNGTFTIQNGVAFVGMDSGGSNFTFTQTGGATTIAGSFDAGHGEIFIQAGTLDVAKQCAMGGFDSGGGNGHFALTQTGGTVTFDGVFNTSIQGLEGGTLKGSGAVNGSLVADAGCLAPGDSPGTFSVTTNFTQSAGNTLLLEVAGRATNQFDRVLVGGTATLGGALAVSLVNNFVPVPGDRFQILTAGTLAGTFSAVTAPAGMAVTYSNNSVYLVVTNTVAPPLTGLAAGNNALSFGFGTVSNQSYTVQQTTNLASTNWTDYTNITGSGTPYQFTAPTANRTQNFFRVKTQ